MTRKPDAAQEEVINADPNARLLVESGPGCGKTDVACARTATLLVRGVPASSIVLLTFTRTAVRELRDRILRLSAEDLDPRGVHVLTLDSFAWAVRKRLVEPNARLSESSYEETFARLNSLLKGKGSLPERERLHEYLEEKHHVMVDESQDLVGVRAEFTELLLSSLPSSCGWTVFIDPAQAIYDWSESDTGEAEGTPFSDRAGRLRGLSGKVSLSTPHRTGNRPLLALQAEARAIVLDPSGQDKYDRVRGLLLDGAFATGERASTETLAGEVGRTLRAQSSRFVLFRRRGDALMLSGALVSAGVRHRLRLGHLRGSVPGWIAAISARLDNDRWTEQAFSAAWEDVKRLNPELVRRHSIEDAWKALRNTAREGRASVARDKLADAIAMRLLPDELTPREVGRSGPIIGSIHASKGREADEVVLVVPGGQDRGAPPEEARVLYVGLSRSRETLRVVAGAARSMFSYSATGRAWRFAGNKGNIQIEVGREGDVHAAGSLLAVPEPATTQAQLLAFDGIPRPVEAHKVKGDPEFVGRDGYRMNLGILEKESPTRQSPAKALGSMSSQFDDDCFKIGLTPWGRGPKAMWFAWLMDVTTSAVVADDPVRARLPEPWRTSRLWLSPVIAGLFLAFKPNPKA